MASPAKTRTARGPMSTAFDAEISLALRGARTVRIETSAAPGRPVHRATIWVVVDDAGRLLVRSYLGERGRWYRELRANPTGALIFDGRRILVRAEPASDPERVEACSAG